MDKYTVRYFKNGYYITECKSSETTAFIGTLSDCYSWIRLKELNILEE